MSVDINDVVSAVAASNLAEDMLDLSANASVASTATIALTASNVNTSTIRKRLLKPDAFCPNSRSSNLFFCGKRKRSNRDHRYYDHDMFGTRLHSCSVPRHNYYMDEYRMRPRSYSSTSKPQTYSHLLPLNKGLVSKIERISQQQKTEDVTEQPTLDNVEETVAQISKSEDPLGTTERTASPNLALKYQASQHHRKKSTRNRRSNHRHLRQQLQFVVDQHPMDCGELNDFLSSSSLSSSESDDDHHNAVNDTDREGDDELTDWPGNEQSGMDAKYIDCKARKLTKKNNLPLIKSEDSTGMAEDDTLMSGEWSSLALEAAQDPLETPRYQPPTSQPIAITAKSAFSMNLRLNKLHPNDEDDIEGMGIPLNTASGSASCKQIESEMSGETSNPFLSSSPPFAAAEVREIRAGCRRIKGERAGFSIKTSVNERLARFLQDARQTQIRLPDIEIYEHESLLNLATLYSLQMTLDNGCAVLTKTRLVLLGKIKKNNNSDYYLQ